MLSIFSNFSEQSSKFKMYNIYEDVTLKKLYFHFLSNWMGYDRGDSFPFDFEPNGILFGSKSKGNLSPGPYPIQYERNWEYSFLSVVKLLLRQQRRVLSFSMAVWGSNYCIGINLCRGISPIRQVAIVSKWNFLQTHLSEIIIRPHEARFF